MRTSNILDLSVRVRAFLHRTYLQGFRLPENIVAVPDIVDVVSDATCLVFCIPHQVGVSSARSLLVPP